MSHSFETNLPFTIKKNKTLEFQNKLLSLNKCTHFPPAAPPLEPLQKLLRTDTGARVDRQLHFADFLINLLHKVNHKIDQLVLVHLLRVKIRNQEANVVALDRFPPQDDKVLRPHHHEPGELVAQDLLDLVGLLDGDADPDRVDRRFDQDAFLLVARNDHRRQQQLLAGPHLDLRLVVPFDDLRRKVGQTHRRGQGVTDGRQVGLERRGHRNGVLLQSKTRG